MLTGRQGPVQRNPKLKPKHTVEIGENGMIWLFEEDGEAYDKAVAAVVKPVRPRRRD
jgi:D-tyrosyl-tRNA(Tyr) deacylase